MSPTERLRWFTEVLTSGGEVGDELEAALSPVHLPHADKIRDAFASRGAQVTGGRITSIEERGRGRALARMKTPDDAKWTVAVSVEDEAPYRVYTMWSAPLRETLTLPDLVTERLILRPGNDSDIDPCAEMEADADVMRWVGDGSPKDATWARTGYENMFWLPERHGLGAFTITDRDSGGFLGRMWLAPLLEDIEVGYVLAKPTWGRGVATEAANAVIRWGFDALKLPQIVAITYPDNLASRNVLQKCGLVRGEDREFIGHSFHYFTRDRDTAA